MSLDALRLLLWITTGLLGAAVVCVAAWSSRNRARVGRARGRVLRRRRARLGILLVALAAAVFIVAGSQIGREPETLALLVLALALFAVSPGFQDTAWGESGVRRGWSARRYEELEAWRLIGEHLRWKLAGEWLATDVQPSEHAALRLELERRAPGRESVHGNAGFDAERAAAAKSNS